jgi:hypothetical protein
MTWCQGTPTKVNVYTIARGGGIFEALTHIDAFRAVNLLERFAAKKTNTLVGSMR